MLTLCVMRILDTQQITTLLHMIGTAEFGVHLLEQDLLGLGHEEVDESSEQEINTSKEVESVKSVVLATSTLDQHESIRRNEGDDCCERWGRRLTSKNSGKN